MRNALDAQGAMRHNIDRTASLKYFTSRSLTYSFSAISNCPRPEGMDIADCSSTCPLMYNFVFLKSTIFLSNCSGSPAQIPYL